MSVKSQHLEAMFARRREQEHARIERTEAVYRYYDYWGKVTSRFQNWTTPEYYKQATDKLQHTKEKKEKEKILAERRKKLQLMLGTEKELYEKELKQKKNPPRKPRPDTKTLEQIDRNLKKEGNLRKKLELEAKLYGKWRHGVDDENLIYNNSKSENEVLAKLNWLDKQVDNQLQKEKEQEESERRRLRLQEELNKAEEIQKERQKIREQEISEVRVIQEQHLNELREREQETEFLKAEEQRIIGCLEELMKEDELLGECMSLMNPHIDLSEAYNVKRLKVFARKRGKDYINQLKLHRGILERVKNYANKSDVLSALLLKCQQQLDEESKNLDEMDTMFDSETKLKLLKREDQWRIQYRDRCYELQLYLDSERECFKAQLTQNLERQGKLVEARSTCLGAVECASEKLKQLIQEDANSPRLNSAVFVPEDASSVPSSAGPEDCAEDESPRMSVRPSPAPSPSTTVAPSSLPEVTGSFRNLNLDVWKDLPSSRRGIDSIPSKRDMEVVTPATAERPRFGRKRVAWM